MPKSVIYVIDDERDILDLYENLLEKDFEVETFESPLDFLGRLEMKTPTLVITDLKMPHMDGLEMIKQGLKRGYEFPFILLSGHLDKDKTLEAMEIGVFRVLEKPTDYKVLLSTIDQLVLEHKIVDVRREVRILISQLRELYGSLRILMSQYVPKEVLDRSVIETDTIGKVNQKQNFEEILERLETRLGQLLNAEKVLVELKTNKFKS